MKTTLRAIFSIAVVLSLGLTAFSQQSAKSIPNSTSPDGIIGFLEFKPKDYGTQKHPLIIFLHGIGERGNGSSQLGIVANNAIPNLCARGATMRFTAGGQTSSFVVLSPQLSTSYGYWPPYYVKEMIKYAKANLQVDPDRIYITGLSLGGGGTWRAIATVENGDYSFDAGIAAAAPVCGTQDENDAEFCSTVGANHLPVWAFHCMDDATVWVGTTQHAEILSKNCGVTPASIFTYYQSGGHGGAWVNAYDTGHITRTINTGASFTANPNLYEWLLSNKRSTGTTPPAYTAPVANAGTAQVITLPISTVTLTGSGTGTNGATISSYSWAKTSGPAGGAISVPLLNTTLITGLVQGVYVFTLTVTDNHGLTNSSNVTVTVNALLGANQNPVSNAGDDAAITLPTNSVSIDGRGSSDPDGRIVEYYWTKVSGPAGAVLGDAFSSNTTLSNLVAGTYVVMLQVKDDRGGIAYSGKTITVNASSAPAPPPPSAPNQSPVSNAGTDVAITLPTTSVALNAGASYDSDGKIVEYYWSKATGPAGFTIADPFSASTTVSNLTQGVYTFVLQVKDDNGAMGYSNKTITVNAGSGSGVNQMPVAITGSDLYVTLPATTATIDAGASYDPDGKIVQYYWKQVSGPSVAYIKDLYSVSTVLSKLVAGKYTFTVQVRDNQGGLAYSNLIVNVVNAGARVAADSSTTQSLGATTALSTKEPVVAGKQLNIYPNPVQNSATIELYSAEAGTKTIYIYTVSGTLAARYIWQTTTGRNVFSLKDISGLGNGIYVLDVKDSSGKSTGSLKFLKIK